MAENPPFGIRSEKPESTLGEVMDEIRQTAVFFVIDGLNDFGGPGVGTIEQRSQEAVCLIVDPDKCRRYPQVIRAHKMRGAKIVILANRADFSRMTEEDAASADAVLADDISAEALMESLRRVCSGERVTSRGLILSIPARAATPDSHSVGGERELTIIEKEVLAGVAQGHSNAIIAWNLGIEEAAVKMHLKSLMQKINVRNRTEAAVWALSKRPAEDSPGRGFI